MSTNRLFQDFISFATDADPGSGGLTLSAPGLADLLTIPSPFFIALTLDPREVFGAPEIVWITEHTPSATTATMLRAQEGTSARAHDVGTVVIASLTAVVPAGHLDLAGLKTMTGALAMGGFGIAGVEGLDPETDVTDDLGTDLLSWQSLYVKDIFDPSGSTFQVDMANGVLVGGRWAVQGDLDPNTDVTFDLGDSSFSWNRLYAEDLYNAAGVQVVSLATKGMVGDWKAEDWDPVADVTHDLGDATKTWRRLYVDDIYERGGNPVIDIDAQNLINAWAVGGHFDPTADVSFDLGDSSRTWRRLYVDELFDRAGGRVLDIDSRELLGSWRVGNHFDPGTNNAHDLGDSTLTWRDLYVHNIKDESGVRVIDTNTMTFYNPSGGARLFKMTFALNGAQLHGPSDGDFIEIDSNNNFIQMFLNSTEVFRLVLSDGKLHLPSGGSVVFDL